MWKNDQIFVEDRGIYLAQSTIINGMGQFLKFCKIEENKIDRLVSRINGGLCHGISTLWGYCHAQRTLQGDTLPLCMQRHKSDLVAWFNDCFLSLFSLGKQYELEQNEHVFLPFSQKEQSKQKQKILSKEIQEKRGQIAGFIGYILQFHLSQTYGAKIPCDSPD